MKKVFDVFQCIICGSADASGRASAHKSLDNPLLVESALNSCQMPKARRGESTHLILTVTEQHKIELLQLLPVPVSVQHTAHHGLKRFGKLATLERNEHIGRHCRRRLVEHMMLMAHRRIFTYHEPGRSPGPDR